MDGAAHPALRSHADTLGAYHAHRARPQALTTIAQITDTHITEPGLRHQFVTDTSLWLKRCVAAINALAQSPDVVVVTGDIANRGRSGEYARARAILEGLQMRYLVLAGNHDNAAHLAAAFADRLGGLRHDGSLSWSDDRLPIRVVALDTTRGHRPGGYLSRDRLEWLKTILADARPAVLLLHHPPLRTGVHYLDAFGFRGRREFQRIVTEHTNVRIILCGHVHRIVERRWSGTTVRTSLSPSPQYVPELFMKRPLWITRERPAFTLHHVDAVDGIASETRFLD